MAEWRENDVRPLLQGSFGHVAGLLIFGSDDDAIGDAARSIGAAWPGEVVVLEPSALKGGLGPLRDALSASSLFGGQTLVLLRGLSEQNCASLAPLLADSDWPGFLLVTAGSLKKDNALRLAATRSRAFHLFGLYEESGAALIQRVVGIAREKGLRLSQDGASVLAEVSGGSRSVISSEVEKLVLLHGADCEVVAEDVWESCGSGEADANLLVRLILDGNAAAVDRMLQRMETAGEASAALMMLASSVSRHASLKAAMEQGVSWEAAKQRVFPRFHFSEEASVKSRLDRRSLEAFLSLQEKIQEAVLISRMSQSVAEVVTARQLLSFASRLGG